MTKIKEVNRTANIAWSPAKQHPIYLAAGTAAQQLDATFSTTAELEIFHVDFGSKDLQMPVAGSLQCNQRLHKVIWGSYGMQSSEYGSGVIIGGTDNGHIFVYDAAKIIAGDADNALAMQLDKHTGPVQALDINTFQENLLASGANDSEIYIWDLRKPENPLTPGAKTTPLDSISCVHWNKQVQHIMASSSPSGRVVVWDLRKSEPIIKVGDTSAMLHCKSMAWHPEVATQMVIGNEDDRYPVIQLWDLRFATSPMKVLEGHQRGILSLDWCTQDPDLLMSCAKGAEEGSTKPIHKNVKREYSLGLYDLESYSDISLSYIAQWKRRWLSVHAGQPRIPSVVDNRILCWNPNSGQNGEIVYELPTTSQWSFEVSWCPRNPGILSTASFDGHVTVSSLMGGGSVPNNAPDKVASSFGSDPHLSQHATVTQSAAPEPLKKPPRWMRRPCAASFAFGGRLVTFGNYKDDSPVKQVEISQVVTEEEFLERSKDLENALLRNDLVEFCDKKIYSSANETENTLWSFLKVNFDKEPRLRFLELLGYHPQELAKKISSMSSQGRGISSVDQASGIDAHELASKMQLLGTGETMSVKSEGGLVISGTGSPAQGSGRKTPASEPDAGSAFEMVGNLSMDDSLNASTSNIDDPGRPSSPLIIATDEDTDGLVSQALMTGNFDGAVDICFKADRMAEALILAVAGGPELFARTQKRYLHQARTSISKLITCVVGRDWRSIVESCTIDNWKEALAVLVTYGRAEEFFELCDLLGQRLENEASNFSSAAICYICSGNVERLVSCASKSMSKDTTPLMLQDLIEKVMVLKKAVEREKRQATAVSNSILADKLSKYSNILASQGSYETAMVYLSTINDQSVAALKDRLLQTQGQKVQEAALPFEKVNVRASPAPQQQQQPKQLQHAQPNQVPSQMQPGYGYQNVSPVQPMPPASTNFYNPASTANMYQGMYQPPQPPMSTISSTPTQAPLYAPPTQMQPPTSFTQMPAGPPPPSTSQYQPNQPISAAPPTQPGYSAMPPTNQMNQFPGQGYTAMPPSPMGPPPPNDPSHAQPPPMSLKQAKQDTHHTPAQQMNMPLFNPAAQQNQMQPNQMQAPSPNSQPGTFVPGQTIMNEQKEKLQPEPVKQEVSRPPIPAEHMELQQTFSAMIEKCKSAANNPQTKRKLEDVTRRVECLYDMLRDGKLSSHVLNGLHQISQACQAMNYPQGIQLHTEMVVRGNFSEISSFMPGLKALMQIATQMRV